MRSIVIAVCVLLGLASRADAGPRIAVVGSDDAGVADAVRDALGDKVEIVEVSGGTGDPVALAREHALEGVVVVEVSGTRRKAKAVVTLLQGSDGARLARYDVKGKRARLAKAAAKKAWTKLKKPIAKARAPEPPPPPEPVVEATPAEAPPPERVAEAPPPAAEADLAVAAVAARPARRGAPWLELAVEGRPFLRTLRYNDDLQDRLRTYDLAAPAAAIAASWRPRPRGAARFLAVRGELELAVGVAGSRTNDGMEYPTSASEWSLGLRGDLPVAGWRLRVDAAYGEHRFGVDDDEMTRGLVPDVTYRWVRGGLAITAPITDRLAVDAGGGWRQLLGTGELGSDAWFPRATGAGIDAELGVAWRAGGPFTLTARADLRRYFFAMNPEVGDELIVGGAVDQYLAIVGGVAVELR